MMSRRAIGIAASIVVVLAVVAGLWANGTPAYQRSITQDRSRSSRLFYVAQRIDGYAADFKTLPDTLADAMKDDRDRADFVTGVPIEYTHSGNAYQLCTVFATDTRAQAAREVPFSSHPAGRACFERTAQPPKLPDNVRLYYMGKGTP